MEVDICIRYGYFVVIVTATTGLTTFCDLCYWIIIIYAT